VRLVGFIIKKFDTMHGHTNVKKKATRLILLAKYSYVIIEHMMWSSQSAAPNDLHAATV